MLSVLVGERLKPTSPLYNVSSTCKQNELAQDTGRQLMKDPFHKSAAQILELNGQSLVSER
jgi:hypothetical protein